MGFHRACLRPLLLVALSCVAACSAGSAGISAKPPESHTNSGTGGGSGGASVGGSGGAMAPEAAGGVPVPGSGGSSGGAGGAAAPEGDASGGDVPVVAPDTAPAIGAGVCPEGRKLVWRLDFSHPGWNQGMAGVQAAIQAAGGAESGVKELVTGTDHVSVVQDPEHGNALQVRYPPGSGSQDCVDLKDCKTAGGIVFFLPLPNGGSIKSAIISYWLKFDPAFDWVRGGKLPGLCGHGCPIAGAKVEPDRFSLRFMWRPGGEAEVYSYLSSPPNSVYGLEMGKGTWSWKNDGAWHHIQGELALNNGNAADGSVRVWYDKAVTDPPDFQQKNLKYYDRTRYPELGIDTFVFTTFHGGHSHEWSPSKEVVSQFADFQVCQ